VSPHKEQKEKVSKEPSRTSEAEMKWKLTKRSQPQV
jgi:hypothetical protein